MKAGVKMDNYVVNLLPLHASNTIVDYVENNGISTECVAQYRNYSPDGKEVIMLVFEKYFMRNSSRASLSVVIENINGRTVVSSVGSGGGQGTWHRFDWGAAKDFSGMVKQALSNYLI